MAASNISRFSVANEGTFENVRDVIPRDQYDRYLRDFRQELKKHDPRFIGKEKIFLGSQASGFIEVIMTNGDAYSGRVQDVKDMVEAKLKAAILRCIHCEAMHRRQNQPGFTGVKKNWKVVM
jgi:hypothetical protein